MAAISILAPSSKRTGSTRFTLARALAMASVMMQARRSRRLLAEMDSRLLADIGTSRGDAHMEASRPFWDIAPRG